MSSEIIKVSHLGLRPYEAVLESMHRFTEQRTSLTNDEIWLVEHPAVYTFGTSIKREHLLHPTTIPVVESDRGGQITYHGPGQLIVYFLIDLKRLKCGVREFVVCMEKSVMSTLQDVGIPSHLKEGAPGVYVEQKKICSLGLRVRHGCTFHGLALNVNMDLTPFEDINPCGYAGMKMTQIKEFIPDVQLPMVAKMLIEHICLQLNLTQSFTEHVTHD